MKYISIIILFVFLLILIVCDPVTETFSILEGIRGRGGGGRGGGGHGGRGRGGRGRGGHRRGGRRWYGGNLGYRYRPPPVVRYSPDYYPGYAPRYVPWLTGAYWFGSTCKDGCTNVGNDRWGCQFPGGGSNDCVFASDCYGCGF
tara:strand:+ start:44 stop:475 length:432 start_codon:yes stop_codon:yes gene_type:complete